ncbi:MAG: hypothetical protein F6K58_32040 [Symploca sp. SIO2E9]|nr:hypothetical protein [Symploca sp. SIO2E9]
MRNLSQGHLAKGLPIEQGGWGEGGDGERGRWGDGEMGRKEEIIIVGNIYIIILSTN